MSNFAQPSSSPSPDPENPSFDIHPRALLKIVAAIALVLLAVKTFTLALLLLLGLFLAVSLEPISVRLQKAGLSRGLAISTIALSMTGIIALVGVVLIPSIYNQVASLIQAFPVLKADVLSRIPDRMAFKDAVIQMLNNPQMPDTSLLMDYTLSILTKVFEGVSELFLTLIFSIYLLVDGKRAFKWISDFFSAPTRLKLQTTAQETSKLIYGYVMGQVITCVSSAVASFLILSVLGVPGALTLGVLAGLFDILPILGFFMAVIPAMLLGFTVSPATGLLVLALYLAYHAFESYVLVPYVYGNSMKVSALVVLIALLIAGTTGGILAALAILPVVASYPIIERVWLIKYLGRHVVEKHAQRTEAIAMHDQVKMWNVDPMSITRPNLHISGKEMIKKMRKRVLIVEDDPDIRSMLQDILETEGYEALVASNGKDGLEVLHKVQGIGLILADIMMPIMDGRMFLDAVKALPKFAHIPVVFLSGSIHVTNTAGAAGVLQKPSEIDVVLNVVDKHYRSPLSV